MTTSQYQQNPTPLGSFSGNGLSLPQSRGGSLQTAGTTPDDASREIGGGPPLSPDQANINQRNNNITQKKKLRANILIATLNMKGRASPDLGNSAISKWSSVQHVMRAKKIGILCIQESHLTNEHEAQIEALYSRRIKVINSKDPFRPGNSAGVAFVLNKELLDTTNIETTEIIPGRALTIKIKRNNNSYLTLLNIYAPNNLTKHPEFWDLISKTWQDKNLPQPDLMLGDFNLTEDSLDRAPARQDNENAVNALRDLKYHLNVQDTWRALHPTSRLFTFYSNTNSHSRLDRIYTSPQHERNTHHWDSCTTAIPSDHKMVLVRFVPQNAPFIGNGRWTWPMSLINDKNLLQKISEIGRATQQEITHQQANRNEITNPQKTWKDFKANINKEAKKTAKHHLHKIRQRTKQLENDVKRTLENGDIDINENTRRHKAWIESEINHLEKKAFKNIQNQSQANWAKNGETISKYWSKINSPKKPRDIIHGLKRQDSNSLATRSDEMANIARLHHEGIQQDDMTRETENERLTVKQNFMNEIPATQKLNNLDSPLYNLLQEHHIHEALFSSKSGSAAGIDGIPYEVWKKLHDMHQENQKEEKPSFDIIKTLTMVTSDIQTHDVDPDSDFTLGWMCPIYKKKERTEIENYRPITLLNTDYKILTKALAMQLAREANKLIHPDQSGFIPK